MLKKKLGIEAIEKNWNIRVDYIDAYYKIPSTLIIPEGCREIGDAAFRCGELKKVVIPESVEWIGYCAFYGCRQATIVIQKPRSEFKYIGSCAFDYCKGVKDVKKEIRS